MSDHAFAIVMTVGWSIEVVMNATLVVLLAKARRRR